MLRKRPQAHALAAATLALCILPAVANATWPHDPNSGNVPVCTAAGDQSFLVSISDGAGGAIVAWQDARSGTADIYIQRMSAAGLPLWTANGVAVCTAVADQTLPRIASDGAGGAILTWMDFRTSSAPDVYAQRVNAAGVPQWTANGVTVCTAANNQYSPDLTADGTGGAIIAWYDKRNGVDYNIYAQRVTSSGTRVWATDGYSICTAANFQYFPVLVADGAGGAVIAWQDARNGANFDIYAQRVNASGATLWTADGVVLCSAAGDQTEPAIVTDGAGGGIVAWKDLRSGTDAAFAQRVSGAGDVLWFTSGVAVCPTTFYQYNPAIASDGASGAIIAWEDARTSTIPNIFAQRLNAGGSRQWATAGVSVCSASFDQTQPSLIPDGAGGVIATWNDLRDGQRFDVYSQRMSSTGQPLWTIDGVAISTAARDQFGTAMASDGANGAIYTWQDNRSVTSNDLYCQRAERFGQLGSPEPAIYKIRDVPADQGGQLKVSWYASYLDVNPTYGIDEYTIWRSTPSAAALRAIRSGARLLGEGDTIPLAPGRTFMSSTDGVQTVFWELIGSQVADGDSGYSFVATTTGDSVGAANPKTIFRVQAHGAAGAGFWNSAADSGYSVDNLPPASPAQFTGSLNAGTVSLLWHVSPESDFARYQLHRGTSAGFVPGPGSLLATSADPGYVGAASQPYTYKLAAEDVHGNLSTFAVVQTGATTAVGDAEDPKVAFLGAPSPNPARAGITMRFGLPAAAFVTLTLYDQQGRRIRELVGGELPAGAHVASWDGCDQAGRLAASGLYFARMKTAGQTFTQRIVAMH